jgi:molecular chaperone GrpE
VALRKKKGRKHLMKEDMREGDRQESLSGDAEGDSLSEGLGSEGTATLQETGEEAGLTAELESKNKEIQSLWDRLLRLQAEFENFKKRTARERTDLIKYANEGLLLEMIPVLDSLDRAIESAKANSNLENFLEGLGLVRRLLSVLLEKAGVKEIIAQGRPFDPQLHEAISVEASGAHPDNTVVEEIQRGYLLHNRVLRPAMVRVAKAVLSEGGQNEGEES